MSNVPNIDNERGWVLMDRFAAGELPAAESAAFVAWMARTPQAAIVAGALRKIHVSAGGEDAACDIGSVWKRIDAAIAAERGSRGRVVAQAGGVVTPRWSRDGEQNTIIGTGMPRSRGILGGRSWYTAFGGVAMTLVILAVWRGGQRHPNGFSSAPMTTYVTHNGQRAEIQLPDGSHVSLGVASRLDVPSDFAAGNHRLALTGQAVFTVRQHERQPFIVVAGGVDTRVLGTTFLVRHYAEDSTATVAVREGKVAVRAVVIAATQQADISRAGVAHVHASDPAVFSFASGILTINGMLLPEAIIELGRWYDADIRLGDPSLATRRIVGECAVGSLADLTNILELTSNVRVVRDGRHLTLYPK